jgi:hypothetical protein
MPNMTESNGENLQIQQETKIIKPSVIIQQPPSLSTPKPQFFHCI